MLRQVLPPLVTAYVVFVAMVVLARRQPVPRHSHSDRSSGVHMSSVVWTTVGGYVAFLAIVLIFHVWLAGETDAFTSAVWGGAFLSGITVVAATGSSLIGRRWRRR